MWYHSTVQSAVNILDHSTVTRAKHNRLTDRTVHRVAQAGRRRYRTYRDKHMQPRTCTLSQGRRHVPIKLLMGAEGMLSGGCARRIFTNIRHSAKSTAHRPSRSKLLLVTRAASCVGRAARVGALRSCALQTLAHLACSVYIAGFAVTTQPLKAEDASLEIRWTPRPSRSRT